MSYVSEVFEKVTRPSVTEEGLNIFENILQGSQKTNLFLHAGSEKVLSFYDALLNTEGQRARDLYVRALTLSLSKILRPNNAKDLAVRVDKLSADEIFTIFQDVDALQRFTEFGQSAWVTQKIDNCFSNFPIQNFLEVFAKTWKSHEDLKWFIEKLEVLPNDQALSLAAHSSYRLINKGYGQWFIDRMEKLPAAEVKNLFFEISGSLCYAGHEEYVIDKLSTFSDVDLADALSYRCFATGPNSLALCRNGQENWVTSAIDSLPSELALKVLQINYVEVVPYFFEHTDKAEWLKNRVHRMLPEHSAKVIETFSEYDFSITSAKRDIPFVRRGGLSGLQPE